MIKLYELTEAYENIQRLIEYGDLTDEELTNVIDTLTGSIQEKAGNIVLMMQNMDADIEALTAEGKRLYSRRVALQNKRDRLEQYLEDNFKRVGLDKVKTTTHTITIQNNPPSIDVINSSKVPKKYKVQEWKLDRKKMLEDIKNGLKVRGARMIQTQGIRIR